MQVRRWWYTVALVAAVLPAGLVCGQTSPPLTGVPTGPTATATPAVTAFPPDTPPLSKGDETPLAEITAFAQAEAQRLSQATNAADASKVVANVLKQIEPRPQPGGVKAPLKSTFLNDYAKETGKAFESLTLSPQSHIAIAATISLASQKNSYVDKPLEQMAITNQNNAAVRYWAAKGITDIVPDIRNLPVICDHARDALLQALSKEKVPLVQAQIVRGLAETEDPKVTPDVIKWMQKKAGEVKAGTLHDGDVDAIAAGVACLNRLYAKTPFAKSDETAALQATADLLDFAASRMAEQAVKTPGSPLPVDQIQTLWDAGAAGVKLANSIAKKEVASIKGRPTGREDNTEALARTIAGVKAVSGDAVGGPGMIQAAFPDVKIPAMK